MNVVARTKLIERHHQRDVPQDRMAEHVAEPLAHVAQDVLPLGRLVGVEAPPHEPERDGRADERRRVDEEHRLEVDDRDEHAGEERPGDHRR